MAQEMLKLRMKHHLSLNAVAEICGIDVLYMARMELGIPVDLSYAQQLRSTLEQKLGTSLPATVLPIAITGDEDLSGVWIGNI